MGSETFAKFDLIESRPRTMWLPHTNDYGDKDGKQKDKRTPTRCHRTPMGHVRDQYPKFHRELEVTRYKNDAEVALKVNFL
jgi:hypothetical protein